MSWQNLFKTQQKTTSNAPHKKGSGFRLLTAKAKSRKVKAMPRPEHVAITTIALAASAFISLLFVGLHPTPEFIVISCGLITLCGLAALDIITRKKWERTTSARIRKLTKTHDRLVREVARNRNDISFVKEGLGGTAEALETQGRRMSPVSSAEARLFETIADQLGTIGDKPRSSVENIKDKKVLSLEMAPPPRAPSRSIHTEETAARKDSPYTDSVIEELLDHAIRNDKIEIFMQPVVNLPQRKTRMYEVFGRIRAGRGVYIPAARFIDMARKADLLPSIDNLILLRSLQLLKEHHKYAPNASTGTPFILNISSATLSDQAFMGDLVTFLAKQRAMAKSLVFELSQKDVLALQRPVIAILEGLSKLGCRFSMDHVRSRELDIDQLKGRHIRYLKLDAGWLLREGNTKQGFARILRIKKQFDRAGIDLIIERIEHENQLRELLDYNIDFGQGILFGKPDLAAAYKEEYKAA